MADRAGSVRPPARTAQQVVTPVIEEHDSRALRRWFTIGTLAVVLLAIWLILRPMAMPIAWAAMLAFLLHPLHQRLTKRLGNRPIASAGAADRADADRDLRPAFDARLRVRRADRDACRAAAGRIPDLFDLSAWLDASRHPRIAATVRLVREPHRHRQCRGSAHLRLPATCGTGSGCSPAAAASWH